MRDDRKKLQQAKQFVGMEQDPEINNRISLKKQAYN